MYKVLIPQDISEPGKAYLRDRGYEVIVGSASDENTIKKEVADCDALLVRTALYPKDVIAAGKKLKVIARYGVGTDNIDVTAAEKQGVYVTIAKNVNVHSVAEHTITLMLAAAKSLHHCYVAMEEGDWEIRNMLPTVELRGKTLGLVGLGNIGREVAHIAYLGLQMNIIGYDAYADKNQLPDFIKLVTLQDLYKQSDVISLHIPATPQTKNMINADVLKQMKNSAFLINCARGGIVNEEDLFAALVNKGIAGAAMDCFEEEPMKKGNRLLTLLNFVGSPHNAGMTTEARDALGISCAKAIDDVLNGREPQYPVNKPILS
jgi:Phosphoglycerate dehydrogenase and related dehydrogenases